MASEHSAEGLAPSLGPNAPRSGARVLVVEDDPHVLRVLRLLAQQCGHEVRACSNGAQAITEFQAFHPQIVVLDLALPGLDGFQVAQRLREMEGADLMIIALTGDLQESYRERAAQHFDQYLVKPSGLMALNELLASMTKRKSAEP
jgi:CheY-like chemotaxis protein